MHTLSIPGSVYYHAKVEKICTEALARGVSTRACMSRPSASRTLNARAVTQQNVLKVTRGVELSRNVTVGGGGSAWVAGGRGRGFSSGGGGGSEEQLTLKQRFKVMAQDYGKVILLSHTTIWAGSLVGAWLVIRSQTSLNFTKLTN
jgi:hypothetical protein